MRSFKVAGFVGVAILGMIFLVACSRSGRESSNQNYDALKKDMLGCEEPAVPEIHPWAKTGQSYGCYIKNGPFVAAEDGYVHLRGRFDNGKEAGVWRWYDRAGNVIKEIDYASQGATSP
ncbi:MAG: hypothetical protein F9K31_03625 [Dokdonella sp.]|nr:MAG: hypothetical protein F9K31_03625 [Dokdonella sp.]